LHSISQRFSLLIISHALKTDVFNNKLTGTLPDELANISLLQIVHLKSNMLTGTIPAGLGKLQYLTWVDLSNNRMHGTIPATFAHSPALKDFRLAGNMIYEPIPLELCNNINLNSGSTKQYGCDGILCPLGTYSEVGHAIVDEGCLPCPEGETTLYLGSTACEKLSEADLLSIFFEVMHGDEWPSELKRYWGNPSINTCEWGGITCNSDGEIVSFSFPLLVAEHI